MTKDGNFDNEKFNGYNNSADKIIVQAMSNLFFQSKNKRKDVEKYIFQYEQFR